MNSEGNFTPGAMAAWVFGGLTAVVLVIAIFWGGIAGCAAYNRDQAKKNAKNNAQIAQIKARNNVITTRIAIQTANQQAAIAHAQIAATKATAEKRFQAAVGIRRAQDEIQSTLTPLYIQHEAIEAQERIATSGKNNTVIYVPAGTNGTPIITSAAGNGK